MFCIRVCATGYREGTPGTCVALPPRRSGPLLPPSMACGRIIGDKRPCSGERHHLCWQRATRNLLNDITKKKWVQTGNHSSAPHTLGVTAPNYLLSVLMPLDRVDNFSTPLTDSASSQRRPKPPITLIPLPPQKVYVQ